MSAPVSGELDDRQWTELRTVVTNLESAIRLHSFEVVDRATQRLAEFLMSSVPKG